MELSALLDLLFKIVVAPVAGALWLLYNRVNKHNTDIAVLQATIQVQKEAHDREFKEVRESFQRVFQKLDNIEEALRK